jgi:hypothetical protein
MGATNRRRVKDTDKTTNLEVAVTGALSLDEMEVALDEVATEMGMRISHITTLGRKRYPGNRHWHLTQEPHTKGCLDVTYWPSGALMWISIRRSEPAWVHEAGQSLWPALEGHLQRRALGES